MGKVSGLLKRLFVPGDLHLIFSPSAQLCHVWEKEPEGPGKLLLTLPMANRTVHGGFGHWGHCPPGLFLLGAPRPKKSPPFGFFFTPLFDTAPLGPMRLFGRRGIGIHGGGSKLSDPYADEQPLVTTEGCLRVHNRDNQRLVTILRGLQARGHAAYIEVLK